MVCRNTPQAAPELKDISEILGPFHQALTPERKPLSHLICKAKKKPSRPSGFSDKHAQVHSRFIALSPYLCLQMQLSSGVESMIFLNSSIIGVRCCCFTVSCWLGQHVSILKKWFHTAHHFRPSHTATARYKGLMMRSKMLVLAE